ncbi:MAG: GerMN domain-containing protein [Actinomycetota bacterium]
MKDGQEVRRIPITVIASVCGLVLVAGGGIAWWTASHTPSVHTSQSISPPSPSTGVPSPAESPAVLIPVPPPSPAPTTPSQLPAQPAPPQTASAPPQPAKNLDPGASQSLPQAADQTVPIYWVKATSQKLEVVPTPVKLKNASQPDTALAAAFDRLLAGPTETTVSSEIPKGTQLRSLKVQGNDIYLDLSQDFTGGGGSESMIGRLGQVIYTATSFNPNAKVWISVEGKPLEVLGGEGLEVTQPTTRQSFEKDFAIK